MRRWRRRYRRPGGRGGKLLRLEGREKRRRRERGREAKGLEESRVRWWDDGVLAMEEVVAGRGGRKRGRRKRWRKRGEGEEKESYDF